MKLVLIFLTFCLSFSALARETKEINVKSMNCTIKNIYGFSIGTAIVNKNLLHLSIGYFQNNLWITSTTESSMTGITPDQARDYTFKFSEKLSQGTKNYKATIYQKFMLGMGGPRLYFANANCSISI